MTCTTEFSGLRFCSLQIESSVQWKRTLSCFFFIRQFVQKIRDNNKSQSGLIETFVICPQISIRINSNFNSDNKKKYTLNQQ